MLFKTKILKSIIVMGGVLLIALPFSYITKAETSDSFSGHWYVWEENVNVSGNQWISYQNVLFVTNDPTAMGQVQVNNTTSGPNNFVQTLDFSGTYTFYSHLFEQPFTLSQGLMPVATSNSRAFTSYTPIQSAHNVEIVQLSSTQIQSLISAIQNTSSYDDTTLLTQLAIIKGVLDNINTSSASSAADIASLLNTSNSILNALNNIDNALDMITWNSIPYQSYSVQVNNSDVTVNGRYQNLVFNISFDERLYRDITPVILRIKIRFYDYPTEGSLTKLNETDRFNFYWSSSRAYSYIYVYDNMLSYGNNTTLSFKFSDAYYYDFEPTIEYITSQDIEYWQLLSYFEQHQYYQNEYPDLENEQSDFNDELDDYLDAEDDLISDFQSAISDPAISPSVPAANPSNWGNTALNSIAFIGLVFNTLTGFTLGGNVFYQMIQFSLMFGLALLIIGKRAV